MLHKDFLSGCKKTKLPAFIHPELATLVLDFPKSGKWSYEVKFDGYRLLAIIKKGQPILKTRNNHDWSDKFRSIIQDLKKLPIENAILDGELVAVNKNGISNFQLLQDALELETKVHLVYYVFDLLYLDGYDLTSLPLWKRRKLLKNYLKVRDLKLVRYSVDLSGGIKKIFAKMCLQGHEGVMAKNQDSIYRQTRTKDWLKIKCIKEQEFVIGGFTDPKGSRELFGALLLGVYDQDENFIYCGKVGTGFNSLILGKVFSHLKKYKRVNCPFSERPPERNVHWVKPILVAEIKFKEWTNDGLLRQPVFLGLRFDKAARTVIKESV